MFCPKCGNQCNDGANFCSRCSTRISGNVGGSDEQRVNQEPYRAAVYSQPQKHPGESSALTSLICGILGIFVLPIILSIIAIVQGNKAKRMGYDGGMATAGVVLGWIGLLLGILGVIFTIFYVIFIFSMMPELLICA